MQGITIHETDPTLVQRITLLAEQNRLLPEEEARHLLHQAVNHAEQEMPFYEEKSFSIPSAAQIEEAKLFRKRYAHLQTTDSVDLLRVDRDR